MPQKTILKTILQEKKAVKRCYEASPQSNSLPKRRLPIRIYLSGMIVYFVLCMIEQKTVSDSSFISLILLDNLIAFFGLFYAVYPLLRLMAVKHPFGDWHYYPKTFDLLALLFLFIGIAIVFTITFHH